jgi:UDPglucose 6-dehydrogenase
LCEALGADVQDVAKGIWLDGRIGGKFLHAGPGFGGSCFPKDCHALARTAQEAAMGLTIVETVLAGNEARKERMAEKVISAVGGSVAGKTLAVLGLTFKPNTDDMRETPSLAILRRLIAAGATIRAIDPAGAVEAKKLLPELVYCPDAYAAIAGAEALVLRTEWNEFRALDLAHVARPLKRPLVVNIYRRAEMEAAGLSYVSVGHPALRPFMGNPQ